ncbi:MAG: hypothetical protein Kow00117_18870 [Phototrophicales bacterium]
MSDDMKHDDGLDNWLDEDEQGTIDKPEESDFLDFEALTLAEVLGLFWRAPVRTMRGVMAIIRTPLNLKPDDIVLPVHKQQASRQPSDTWRNIFVLGLCFLHALGIGLGMLFVLENLGAGNWFGMVFLVCLMVSVAVLTLLGLKNLLEPEVEARFGVVIPDTIRRWLVLMVWLMAFIIGVRGGFIMLQGEIRTETNQLYAGTPYLLTAFWLMIYTWWWRFDAVLTSPQDDERNSEQSEARHVHPVRIFAGIFAGFLAVFAFFEASNNQFTTFGFWAWMLSVLLTVITFAPSAWLALPRYGLERILTYRERRRQALEKPFTINWTLVFLILIVLVAAVFRLHDLAGMPPEMTSDHKEKLLDAQRVVEGDRDIFFMNNGGREGFQMYALAAMHTMLGMELNHLTLKILAVIESLITIPAIWWMARQVAGEKDREFGNTLGLILAGLLAVSYWHVAITRLALRIVLTPLVAALLIGFLARGMRHNRRGDFLIAGIILGYGLYTYQAVRMLPVVVLVCVGLAVLWHWRDRPAARRYIGNLMVLVIVSFVIFIPLFRFSIEYPDSFWMRSAGRLFGDDVIQSQDEYGRIIMRDATLEERLTAFRNNLPELAENIRGALLMFNWKGDVGWINGLPLHPEMDPYTGVLLVMGVAGVLILFWRKRDPVYLLMLLAVFIMLLPSALSIAMTIENPSATRASGAIPPAYFLTAIPLTFAVLILRRVIRWRMLTVLPPAIILLLSFHYNTDIYFNDYREAYRYSTWPYSIPGKILRGYVMSEGAYGNAFMIGYSNWWDYTIVGMEGGMMAWQNGIVNIQDVPNRMNDLAYCADVIHRFDPNRDMLFFYHYDDTATQTQLETWFPAGYSRRVMTYYEPYDFMIFRVPALGDAAFREFVETYALGRACSPPPAVG